MLETLENEGATSKYSEYTDIKVSGHILEVFMALKNIFFSDQSCLFSATVVFSNVECNLIIFMVYIVLMIECSNNLNCV